MKTTCNKGFSAALIMLLLLFNNAISVVAATIEIDSINPVILIEKISMEQAVAGCDFNLSIAIRNISSNPGFNLNLSFKVEGTDAREPFELKPKQITTVGQLDGNSTKTLNVGFTVKPEAQNKDYNLIASINGQNASFQDVVSAMTIIQVPVTYDMTKPVLLVKAAFISPEAPNALEGFDAHFQIWNMSKTTDARNVRILVDGKNNFELMEFSNRKNLVTLEKGACETVSYRLMAKDAKADNTVKVRIEFDYLGNNSEGSEEEVALPLPRQDVGVGAKPRVIVNKYTLSTDKVQAGDTLTLHLFIENTNQRPVQNVRVSLGINAGKDNALLENTNERTVFSPINGSNSFFLDYILGKTTIRKDIELFVDPNAEARTYLVPVKIEYEDRKGTELTSNEQVNIPVIQECKLLVLSARAQSSGMVGQPLAVSAEYVNVGKVALSNFMVQLEGDFENEEGIYYVGTMDIGATDFFQSSIIPSAEGDLDGKIVFSYIDNNNKEVRIEKPFTAKIQPSSVEAGGKSGQGTGSAEAGRIGLFGGGIKKAAFILFILIIVLQTIFIWCLKNKKSGASIRD